MSSLLIGVLLLGGVAWLLVDVRRRQQDRDESDALRQWRERKRKEDAAKKIQPGEGRHW